MKKDSFHKKLAAYIVMSEAFLLAHPLDADAQIMYTDVNPDLLIQNSYFNLDLNNDGIADFKLGNSLESSSSVTSNDGNHWEQIYMNSMKRVGQNKIATTLTAQCFGKPYEVLDGEPINQYLPFTTNSLLYSHHILIETSANGNSNFFAGENGCIQGNDVLVGLKVVKNGGDFYGWARLQVYSNRIQLREYAINTIPDSTILAGIGAAGCPANSYYTVPSGQQFLCPDNAMDISIYNSTGHSVQWMQNGNILNGVTDTVFTARESSNYEILIGDSLCPVLINAVNLIPPELSLGYYASGETCGNADAAIQLAVYGNLSSYTYQWSSGATTQDLENIHAGTYIVIVTGSSCSVTDTAEIVVPTIAPAVHPVVYRSNHTLSTDYYNNYKWYKNGVLISNAYTKQYDVTESGYYQVATIGSLGCTGISDSLYVNYINAFNFFINNREIVFEFPDLYFIGSEIELFNDLGQLVNVLEIKNEIEQHDLSVLPTGIYFYHIRCKQKTYSGKFFIE